ncbi:MAG: shikimate 5-dehydrogenase, partial [Proteobacteria bacterium]
MNPINKDTILCLSLAARPSNFGTSFHNYLYQQLGLDYIYKAVNPGALEDAVRGIRGLRIRGCGVSMPFKEEVIPMLDKLDPSAAR